MRRLHKRAERFPYEGIVEALRFSLPFVASVELDTLRASIIALLVPELSVARTSPTCRRSSPLEQARCSRVSVCIERMGLAPMLIILEISLGRGRDGIGDRVPRAPVSRSAVLIVGTYRRRLEGRIRYGRSSELRGAQPMSTCAPRSECRAVVVERLPIDERELIRLRNSALTEAKATRCS